MEFLTDGLQVWFRVERMLGSILGRTLVSILGRTLGIILGRMLGSMLVLDFGVLAAQKFSYLLRISGTPGGSLRTK